MARTHQCIVVADARSATMFRCRITPGHEWHLDPLGSITNSHEKEHRRERPTELSGPTRGDGAHGAPHMASPGRAEEEEHRRFALELATREGWLSRMIRAHNAEHVHLFAPAPFLGLLRAAAAAHPGSAHADPITMGEGELTNLSPTQLATHPRIAAALGAPTR